MAQVMMICDLKDPGDPQGRTYREINAAKVHAIPIGTLVELDTGERAWVVSHDHDCDQTPLYSLSLRRDDTERHREGFANPSWLNGISEPYLCVVEPQPTSKS